MAFGSVNVPGVSGPELARALSASERRVVDTVMGALMAGNISSTLETNSGVELTAGNGEALLAHLHVKGGAQHSDSQIAGLFPLFERMTANNIAAR